MLQARAYGLPHLRRRRLAGLYRLGKIAEDDRECLLLFDATASRNGTMADSSAPTIRTFQVFPDLPTPLEPLLELARNLWWVWNPDAVELFRRLDRKLWDDVYHNPVKMLGSISQAKLAAAANDDGYLAHLGRVYTAYREHMGPKGWFNENHGDLSHKLHIAYFSAEFGLHESLPIYSGGL